MKASAVNKIALNKIVYGFICFSAVFALYASTACRTLPPYRDSGELIATAATLGIAHSPGYPLYTITGKAFIVLGEVIGFNAALSMNLLSAAAGALAALLIFLILCEVTGDPLVSVFGSFSASFAYINWYLSLVAEMYTLSLMFSMLFLYLALKKKYLLLFFCAGLSLGNHLTVIFVLIPVFLYISYDRFFSKTDPVKAVLLFAGGFLVYLYLPVRASGGPFINWGDPSSLSSLLRVITRAAYGHTLDLVSREVTQSQVLIPQLLYFGKSLLRDIGSYGLLLAAWGAAAGLRNRASRPFLLTLLTVFFLTGPWFIYMARMPVNPHALAIIEVGYMVPVSVLAITASLGISFIKNRVFRSAVLVTAFVLTVIGASATLTRVNMKDNYFAEDYALNLLESLPDGAAVMMRKDHPLFSLWYMQGIRGVRGDVAVISKGLLPAGWYRDKLKKDYPWINWPSYINDEQFTEELSGRVAVYLSPASAAEFSREFFKKYELKPYGLVLQISSGPVGFDIHGVLEKVRENYRFRGEYITDSHYDFFTRDFINQYAKFYYRAGSALLNLGDKERAYGVFVKSSSMDPAYSAPVSGLAYIYFKDGDLDKAALYYIRAADIALEKKRLHTRKEYFHEELGDIFNNLGAVYERKYRAQGEEKYYEEALEKYRKAVFYRPDSPVAYYNIGVLNWHRRNWEGVEYYFSLALERDPDNQDIVRFLRQARENLRRTR